jgi:hypothetical protein
MGLSASECGDLLSKNFVAVIIAYEVLGFQQQPLRLFLLAAFFF